jgi:maleamate amidohydrolase
MEESNQTARQLYETLKANPLRRRFGFGRKPMLVNIDLQRGFTAVGRYITAYETDPKQLQYIGELAQLARDRDLPIVWTYVKK